MRRYHPGFAALVIALPLYCQAVPITYDFQATGNFTNTQGTPPPLPAELLNAPAWDIQGSIVVDNEINAVMDDPFIRLGQQIVGASLTINSLSAGTFDSGSFLHAFMDGFEGSTYPYQSDFTLFFNGEDFGASYLSFHSEDFNFSGPDLRGVDLGDAGSFLRAVAPDHYSELQLTIGSAGNLWDLSMDLATDFVPRDETAAVPEPNSISLLLLGVAALFWIRWRRKEKFAATGREWLQPEQRSPTTPRMSSGDSTAATG